MAENTDNIPQNLGKNTTNNAENNAKTLRELLAPTVEDEPLWIVLPEGNVPFKLNSRFLNKLLIFNGHTCEYPNRHIKEFHVVCKSNRTNGVPVETVKLFAFPFSLQDYAKDLLYELPSNSIHGVKCKNCF